MPAPVLSKEGGDDGQAPTPYPRCPCAPQSRPQAQVGAVAWRREPRSQGPLQRGRKGPPACNESLLCASLPTSAGRGVRTPGTLTHPSACDSPQHPQSCLCHTHGPAEGWFGVGLLSKRSLRRGQAPVPPSVFTTLPCPGLTESRAGPDPGSAARMRVSE